MASYDASASRHSLSNLHMMKTVEELVGLQACELFNADSYEFNIVVLLLQKLHNLILLVFVPICIAVVIMSCFWSDIYGKGGSYTDKSSEWQT